MLFWQWLVYWQWKATLLWENRASEADVTLSDIDGAVMLTDKVKGIVMAGRGRTPRGLFKRALHVFYYGSDQRKVGRRRSRML